MVEPGDEIGETVILFIKARDLVAGMFLRLPHGDAFVELVGVEIEEDMVTVDAGFGQARLDLDEMVEAMNEV